jgi:hypothetical protein
VGGLQTDDNPYFFVTTIGARDDAGTSAHARKAVNVFQPLRAFLKAIRQNISFFEIKRGKKIFPVRNGDFNDPIRDSAKGKDMQRIIPDVKRSAAAYSFVPWISPEGR